MAELSISDTQVILIFSRDDPRRTILFDHRTSHMAYRVTTTGDERSGDMKYEMDIVNAQDTSIASLRSRTLRSDLLTLADGTSVSESDWLKRNLLNDTATFKDSSGAQLKWKVDKQTQNMSLYEAGGSHQPLATYRRSRDVSVPPPGSDLISPSVSSLPWLSTSTLHTLRNDIPSSSSRVEKEEYKQRVPATLALSAAAMYMQDLVVISYLLFQRARRSPTGSHAEDDVSVSADGKTLTNAVGEPERVQDCEAPMDLPIETYAYAYAFW
ncbi:uncharacterized protein SCHCODRAFT_02614501 [Schizophyllum commune H4-8]|nr:uncharacterized protein SCHCODRAFT_02614501 [Schizophyllum commune H4-8]KAI5896298.1 hypothetical protein SCHCODRAFT_02614501 [Schizophyllum commune H4-8]